MTDEIRDWGNVPAWWNQDVTIDTQAPAGFWRSDMVADCKPLSRETFERAVEALKQMPLRSEAPIVLHPNDYGKVAAIAAYGGISMREAYWIWLGHGCSKKRAIASLTPAKRTIPEHLREWLQSAIKKALRKHG
jgi:hypothetical protein